LRIRIRSTIFIDGFKMVDEVTLFLTIHGVTVACYITEDLITIENKIRRLGYLYCTISLKRMF